MHRPRRCAVTELLGREPQSDVRGRRPRRRTANPWCCATHRCARRHARCPRSTGWPARTHSAASAGWRPPAACARAEAEVPAARDRRRPCPLRRRTRRARFPRATPARARRAASPAPARASSACTRTTPTYLAGGDDPVGRWVAEHLDAASPRTTPVTTLHIDLGQQRCVLRRRRVGASYTVPVGTDTLAAMIVGRPAAARGAHQRHRPFMDHIEDVTREVPGSTFADGIEVARPGSAGAGRHRGRPPRRAAVRAHARRRRRGVPHARHRDRRRPRRTTPGCPPTRCTTSSACVCAVVATLRGLQASTPCPSPATRSARMSGRGHGHPSMPRRAIRLYGRRVMLRPLTAGRLAAVERSAPAQRAVAHPVGAAAPGQPARPHPRPRRVHVAVQRPRPRPPDGHRLRLRRVRRRRLRRRDQPQRRRPRRAAGRHHRLLDRPRQGRAALHRRRRGRRCCGSRSSSCTCTAWRSASCRATATAGGWWRCSAIREEGVAQRFLEINGTWEDHVRYGITAEEWQARRDELVGRLAVTPHRRPVADGSGLFGGEAHRLRLRLAHRGAPLPVLHLPVTQSAWPCALFLPFSASWWCGGTQARPGSCTSSGS